jgi:hypothetical protein
VTCYPGPVSAASRPLPYPGMPVWVMHLGVVEPATVDEVRADGRTLVVGGTPFTLRDGEPYYGTRLLLSEPEA